MGHSNKTFKGTSNAADAVQPRPKRSGCCQEAPSTATWSTTTLPGTPPASPAVLRFLSSWTRELHRLGYLSGVYAHLYSGALHLSDDYFSTSLRPAGRVVDCPVGQGPVTPTGWADIPDSRWAERGKQYLGDQEDPEVWGGVGIYIDRDLFDAPVATVAYNYSVTSSTPLNGRSGPSTSSAIVQDFLGFHRQGRLPDGGHQGLDDGCLEQAHRRQLPQRLLREHAFEHQLQRAAAAVHVSLSSDHPDTEQAHRPRRQLRHLGHPPRRRPRVGDLPTLRIQSRHDVGLGQAGRRQLRHRLLPGDAQQNDVQPAASPLLT